MEKPNILNVFIYMWLNVTQINCYEQVGSTDCRLLAISYAVDLLNGHDICDLIYDQTKIRNHLIYCFEQRKITTFLLYKKEIQKK